MKLTNEVKFLFILLLGLYGAVGLCLGGFVWWFWGLKIVDKWFYFQKFNVFFCVNTITGFWEGQDVGCAGMMGWYVCSDGSFWWAKPTDIGYCAPVGLG